MAVAIWAENLRPISEALAGEQPEEANHRNRLSQRLVHCRRPLQVAHRVRNCFPPDQREPQSANRRRFTAEVIRNDGEVAVALATVGRHDTL